MDAGGGYSFFPSISLTEALPYNFSILSQCASLPFGSLLRIFGYYLIFLPIFLFPALQYSLARDGFGRKNDVWCQSSFSIPSCFIPLSRLSHSTLEHNERIGSLGCFPHVFPHAHFFFLPSRDLPSPFLKQCVLYMLWPRVITSFSWTVPLKFPLPTIHKEYKLYSFLLSFLPVE